jgi:hypothetical protein
VPFRLPAAPVETDLIAGAEARTDFALSCRPYHTDAGLGGQPDERWVRAALADDRR